MAIGGPILTFALLRVPPRRALMLIFTLFLLGNVFAATATSYPMMVVARIVSGAASQAFFGISVSMSVRLVNTQLRGRAVAVVMNGLMLGTLLGLPLATFVGAQHGWQSAFWTVSLITLVAAAWTLGLVRYPASQANADTQAQTSTRSEFAVLRKPQFLFALTSSALIIGATFSVFSFFAPILTQVTGFSEHIVPLLHLTNGAATLVGNMVVGRFADRHTISTLLVGTGFNVIFLAGFALFTDVPPLALVFMVGIGLIGVTMNPAVAVRIQRAGSTAPLVNTVHGSFITLGVIIGSAVGSTLIPQFGLRSPIILGIVLAILAILAILPAMTSLYLRNGTHIDNANENNEMQAKQPDYALER